MKYDKAEPVEADPTTPLAISSSLRTLHKGMTLLNMCIQRPGAGDGPTSVVLEFLFPKI